MKTTRNRQVLAFLALAALAGCDYLEKRDVRHEHEDRHYQAAMADYSAGRLESAMKGFEKVIRKDPGNAAARFQMACLQQDVRKDYLSAYCGYNEYLLQHPNSDKSKLARDRKALCEREVAKLLASRYSLGGEQSAAALADLQRDLKASETRVASLEKELETVRARERSLTAERTRMLAMIKSTGEESTDKPVVRNVRDLLDDDETDDRVKRAANVAALRREEAEDLAESSSLLSSKQTVPVKREAVEKPKSAHKIPVRPKTYTVQEGDTLYRIAERFYGYRSAWQQIREANKAMVTTDGRIRTGDVLVLP